MAKGERIHLHPMYRLWVGMRGRCQKPAHPNYRNYGAKGITVCERWNDFRTFLADMGERPSKKHQLHRVKNEQGYETGNCVWILQSEHHALHSFSRRK